MRAEYISHTGAVRKNNEDAIFCDVKNGVFAVADGIGGKEAGEVASATAVRIVAECIWEAEDEEPGEILHDAFLQANAFIWERGKEPPLSGMGTTLTAVAVRGREITLAHVGDSRAYLINREEVRQLTQDHSLVAQLVREGKLSPAEARFHPNKNILIRAIGLEAKLSVDIAKTSWHKGDFLLLATDGLYNLVDEEELQEMLMRTVELRTAVTYLAELAYKRGGYDNISLLVAAYD